MLKTAQQLVAEAEAHIVALEPAEAHALARDGTAVLVDIRDIRELAREGRVPGAVHAPRGMLEFWVDPQSPYHRQVFAQPGKTFVFFCAAAWRSALATRDMQAMGLAPVAHVKGGFQAWREASLPVEQPEPREPNAT